MEIIAKIKIVEKIERLMYILMIKYVYNILNDSAMFLVYKIRRDTMVN